MQTRFTDTQRQDPDIRLAEEILRKCVHCGFCLATCPTYVLGGDERDSPRGRIYLMKAWLEEGEGAADTQRHLDRCLTCGSCETTCPSGVDYLKLAGLTRNRVEKEQKRLPWPSLKRVFLLHTLPSEGRFRLALTLGRLFRPLRALLPKGLGPLFDLIPGAQIDRIQGHQSPAAKPSGGKRVALHLGCVQRSLRPNINAATRRVLEHLGCTVIEVSDFGCCGALPEHLGAEERFQNEARRNIAALSEELERGTLNAIISNASGCGKTLKDYGHLMRGTDMAEPAEEVARLTLDITEFLVTLDLGAKREARGTRVAWQSPCSLQHGQGLGPAGPKLLRHFGYDVAEPREPHLCCGFAGTYSILEPERSKALQDRKLRALQDLEAEVIASANIGCITGLDSAGVIPVRHVIELIDEAIDSGR